MNKNTTSSSESDFDSLSAFYHEGADIQQLAAPMLDRT